MPVDVNNDAELDLIITDDDHQEHVLTYLNLGQKKFMDPIINTTEASYSPIQSVAVGDINCDRKSDFVLVRKSEIQLLLNINNGAFGEPLVYESKPHLRIILIKDMNDDNQVNLVLGYVDRISIWYIHYSF